MKLSGLILLVTCFTIIAHASETTSKNISISDIHEINVEAHQKKFNSNDHRNIKLHISQKDSEELRITAPENEMSKIKTETSNGLLTIDISPLSGTKVIDIYIATKATNKIQIVGNIETVFEGNYENAESIEVINEKGSVLTAKKLKAPKIKLTSSYGSEIKLAAIISNQLICASKYGGKIDISETGKMNMIDASASYGGEINAPLMSANHGKFNAGFGGILHFNHFSQAEESSTFGGEIDFLK